MSSSSIAWFAATSALVLVAGCGTPAPQAHVATVVEHVHVGDTIRWTNLDKSQHTATSDKEGVWDSPRLDLNGVFEFRFAAAGEYRYHCAVHPFMHGAVIVESP